LESRINELRQQSLQISSSAVSCSNS
jgi:hypothetical protein